MLYYELIVIYGKISPTMNGYIERTDMNRYEKMLERYETEEKHMIYMGIYGDLCGNREILGFTWFYHQNSGEFGLGQLELMISP